MTRRQGTFSLFAYMVGADWYARMNGVVAFTLTITGAIFQALQLQTPAWLFWAGAGICLVVVSYRVWLREHLAREEEVATLKAELATQKAERVSRNNPYLSSLEALVVRGREILLWFELPDNNPLCVQAPESAQKWAKDVETTLDRHSPADLTFFLKSPFPDWHNPHGLRSVTRMKLARLEEVQKRAAKPPPP